jgi:hypothetical protein
MDRFAEFLKKNGGYERWRTARCWIIRSSFTDPNMGNSDKHSNWPIPTVVVGGGNGTMKLGWSAHFSGAAGPARQCAPDSVEQVRHRTRKNSPTATE